MSSNKPKIGWIGLGIMGRRMAGRLWDAGYELIVCNRSQAAIKEFLGAHTGAVSAATAADVAREADIVFTMLSDPAAVRAVVLEPESGLLAGASGKLWVDASTVDPAFSREMGGAARAAGAEFLDAPVAGSREPAANGELVFLVGGPGESLSHVEEILAIMGKKTVHAGQEHGAGSSLKLVVNFMLGQAVAAYSEACLLGRSLGLNDELMQNVLLATPVAAPFLQLVRQRLESGDTSTHFPLKHMRKDLRLAVESAAKQNVQLGLGTKAGELYDRALNAGLGDSDFSAVFRVITESSGAGK